MMTMFFLGMFAGLSLAAAVAFYSVLFGKIKITKNVAKRNVLKFLKTGHLSWKEVDHVYIYRR